MWSAAIVEVEPAGEREAVLGDGATQKAGRGQGFLVAETLLRLVSKAPRTRAPPTWSPAAGVEVKRLRSR